jgi:nitrogen fixation protein NifT
MEKPEMWGGVVTLQNGWQLELPPLEPDTKLPITVEARKLAGE